MMAAADAEPRASILIVDDHHANLVALEAVLQPLAVQVVRATSGADALKQVLQRDFALIIMDVQMPELDGYQTMALIRGRERSRSVPVIFLTAVYQERQDERRGYELGAIDYITKPFDPERLRAKVRSLVALYEHGQLAERARNAEKEHLREMFVGVLGHDLRNPLNTIQLSIHRATRDDSLADEHRRTLERADRAATRMHRMIADILDMTRTKLGGGIGISPARTDLSAVCRAVLEELAVAHPERRVQLDVEGDISGRWDADRLTRVVSNLVGNALQHSETDIRVTVRPREGNAVIDVHNAGRPIAPDRLSKLFEPFHRVDPNRRGGLGLGLYIVREIVRAHGGTVEVRSTEADGTTFTVMLPREP